MAHDIPFSELTTLRVGGPARRLVTATTQRDLVDLALEAWEHGGPWLALGGGSNLLVGDEGFDGTVVRAANRGIEVLSRGGDLETPTESAPRSAETPTASEGAGLHATLLPHAAIT